MQEIMCRSSAKSEQDVIDKPPPLPRARRIVERGNFPGGQATKNVGIVGLPPPVIALADECGSDGIGRS